MRYDGRIKEICSYCIMGFLFFLPISTSITEILAIIIILLWLIDGNFKEKFSEVKNNKVALAILAYVALNIIGLLWTSDMDWGLYTVKKQWKLLLMPVIMNMAIKDRIKHYLLSFIASILFSTAISYLLWLKIIEHSREWSVPSLFLSHVVYTPLLSFAIYLLWRLRKIICQTNIRVVCWTFIILMSIDMFLVHGRTGQISFAALLVLACVQFAKENNATKKIIPLILLIIPLTFGSAFLFSSNFKTRVESTIENFNNYSETSSNSVSQRLTFIKISIEIIKKNLLVGVGSGDFPMEYRQTLKRTNPSSPFKSTENPHNQYLLVFAQFGLVGLFFFTAIFYHQIRSALDGSGWLNDIRIALPLFCMIIFFGDTYLQTSTTALLISSFSGIIYKKTEKHVRNYRVYQTS